MTAARRLLWGTVGLGLLVTAIATALSGAVPESIPGLPDPGPVVARGLSLASLASRLLMTLTVGLLLAAVVLLPNRDRLEGLSVDAVRLAAGTAAGWAAATAVLLVFSVSDTFARPLDTLNPALFTSYVRDFGPGRALVMHLVAAIAVALVVRWSLAPTVLVSMVVLAVASVVPLGLTGHSAGSGAHGLATVALVLHIAGAMVWVGGLVALAWVAWRGSKRLPEAVERYSPLALVASVAVLVSGTVGAIVNVRAWDALTSTGYGWLVVAKVVLGVALVGFGLAQRRAFVRGVAGFARLATVEVVVMVAAFGAGVALARTPRPVGDDRLVSRSEQILGGPVPPEPTLGRLFTEFIGNGFGVAVVAFGAGLYLWGVRTLRARGDVWPWYRTVFWLVGLAVVGWATFGGLGLYSMVMFSMHMISHMMLSMVATIFLVLGAPMTLALRALPGPRRPGEKSPRALLLAFLHSRYSRFITHPIVAAAIFMGSLYALYFTDLFGTLMGTHTGHLAMEFHFLLSGFLFFYVIIGLDPSPKQFPPLVRVGLLMVSLPFHAFFSVTLMSSSTLIAEDYYRMIDRPYSTDLLADQSLGGGIAWGMGELPLVIVTAAIFILWIRHDRKETRRRDRAADRDGEAELAKYNAYLESLHQNRT